MSRLKSRLFSCSSVAVMAAKITHCLTAFLALCATPALAVPGGDNNNNQDVYDYIVVGSGPGGSPLASNLAKSGYSVLLLEAGDDQSADIGTQLINVGSTSNANRWGFYVRQYGDDTQQLKNNHLTWRRAGGSLFVGNGSSAPADATPLGVFYPRGATLGGSSVINAGVTVLPSKSTWDAIWRQTGDRSWSGDNIRKIFTRIERNHYLPPGTLGHGFNGYLDINGNDGEIYTRSPGILSVFKSMVASIGGSPNNAVTDVTRDINSASLSRDTAQGLFGLPFHANQTWGRFSARTIVLDTLAAKKPNGSPSYPLTLKINSLVTKVLFDRPRNKKPRATGVEYLEGTSLYSADPRHTSSTTGLKRTARARKEVILSGGVFNTPQLLQLSGIGPKEHLRQLNIPVIVDLPGVGSRLQDNPEYPVVGIAKDSQPFFTTPLPGEPECFFGFGPPGVPDPCIDLWYQGLGPYARPAANTNAFMLKTNYSTDGELDILVFSLANFAFRGYWPNEAVVAIPPDPPGVFGFSIVKINPISQAGTVRLRSTNPQDTPLINFEMFKTGADQDLSALAEAAAWGRRVYGNVEGPIGPMTPTEPPCAPGTNCFAGDKQWAKDQSFGHHATSTCAIGGDRDRLAVLDSKFRVRGVDGLRVVDGSAFPKTPGAFPVLSTFLLSEKASVDVLGDAMRW